MKPRMLLLIPLLVGFSLTGCAVRASYYRAPYPPARVDVYGAPYSDRHNYDRDHRDNDRPARSDHDRDDRR